MNGIAYCRCQKTKKGHQKQTMKTVFTRKLNTHGFAHHFILPVLAVIAVAGIGAVVISTHAATAASYYNGVCTSTTLKSGSTGTCVNYAQALLNGLEHQEVATGHSYRAATKAGSGVFQSGSYFYLVMQNTYTTATGTAVKNLDGSTSLTGGTNANGGWQLLCTAAAAYGLNNTASGKPGASKLSFNSKVSGEYTNLTMGTVFSDSCGTKTAPTAGSTTWSITGTSSANGATTFKKGTTIKITNTLKNVGSQTSGTFSYGMYDFYSPTATPSRTANEPYSGEGKEFYSKSATLKSGQSLSVTTSVTMTTSTPLNKYFCFTEAVSPYNSAGAKNGRSTPVCVDTGAAAVGAPSTSSGSSSGGSSSSGTPYASALSSYKTVAQSYVFGDPKNQQTMVAAWANYADQSQEGGNKCSTTNATYDAANLAAKLTTTGSGSSCAHLRAPVPSPTKNSVLESKILMPGSSSTSMLDWGSYWTDGANQNTSDPNAGASNESWPKDGEVDAVETQYGQSYVSIHCGCRSDYNSSTNSSTVWTTEPSGWEGSNVSYVAPTGTNIGPVWTTVDIEFKSDGSVNIYYNGKLFTTVTASAGKTSSWNTGYMYATWGIGPPGASSSSWPGGAGSEEVQYFKVFTQ